MCFKVDRKPHLTFSAGFVTPSSAVSIRTSAAGITGIADQDAARSRVSIGGRFQVPPTRRHLLNQRAVPGRSGARSRGGRSAQACGAKDTANKPRIARFPGSGGFVVIL